MSMYLVTYHNPLQGISFQVTGVADTVEEAKDSLRHYFSGVSHEWQEHFCTDKELWIWKVNPGAGIQYVIQEVRVL